MLRAATIRRKLGVAWRQPLSVLLCLFPAWLLIGIASAMLALVPFRRIAPLLGVNLGAVAHRPACTPRQAMRARRIGASVTIAARYAPFRSNCLPQAMAARALCWLFGVPCAVYLGVDREAASRELRAHAWTSCGEVTLTGAARSFAHYAPLSCFVPAAEAAAWHAANDQRVSADRDAS
ncbi:lasso peptide biosynthesis B2 protein [Sphingomonas sp.]|uniref:lasso peptide biosynthesis B2 protein n=1 Tax=Sphingomonas sp. TaxID=28214 RepID=UPI00307CE924